MISGKSRVRAVVLAAALFLPALPLRALPLDGTRDFRGALSVLFDGLGSFWHGLIDPHGAAGAMTKEGMSIDPRADGPVARARTQALLQTKG